VTVHQPERRRVLTWVAVFLGFVLLAAGFVVRHVRARGFLATGNMEVALWIGGAALVAGALALGYRALLGAFRRPRTTEEANFVAVVLLTVALAGLLCYISTRRYARMDWTGMRRYKLHSQTENTLRSLNKDVDVMVLFSDEDPRTALQAVADMLEEFQALTRRIKVTEINWPQSPAQVRQLLQRLRLGEEELRAAPCIIFATADSHEVIPLAKVTSSSRGPMYRPDTFSGEAAFGGALIKLIEMKRATLYALTGHGERPFEAEPSRLGEEQPQGMMSDVAYSFSGLAKALQNDNYEVKALNLQTAGRVPEDCAVLIVAGPRARLGDSEVKAIRDYLDNRSGRALVMADPDVVQDTHGNLDQLLQPYGVRLHAGAVGVWETVNLLGGTVTVPLVPVDGGGMAHHPATADLEHYMLLFEQACPLEIQNPRPQPTLQTQALLTGVESSWGETEFDPRATAPMHYDAAKDAAGPVVVGAVVQPASPPDAPPLAVPQEELPGPEIVVLGSSLSFVNAALEERLANRYLVENAINWMAGKTHLLGIPPKTLESSEVSMSESQIIAARYVFVAVLPGLIVALGIGVWLLRRR
jgi:hypothetical protein